MVVNPTDCVIVLRESLFPRDHPLQTTCLITDYYTSMGWHTSSPNTAFDYYYWYTTNILTISVFNATSIGSGLVVAVLLCM